MDIILGTGALIGFPDEVKQARVHFGRLVATPVAQRPIGFLETVGEIFPVLLEGDRRLFAGVKIVQLQRTRFSRSRRCARCQGNCKCSSAETGNTTCLQSCHEVPENS